MSLKESSLVVVYLIFMASSKFIRAAIRVLKMLMKKNKKSKQKLLKKINKEKLKKLEVQATTSTHATTDDDVREKGEKKETETKAEEAVVAEQK